MDKRARTGMFSNPITLTRVTPWRATQRALNNSHLLRGSPITRTYLLLPPAGRKVAETKRKRDRTLALSLCWLVHETPPCVVNVSVDVHPPHATTTAAECAFITCCVECGVEKKGKKNKKRTKKKDELGLEPRKFTHLSLHSL